MFAKAGAVTEEPPPVQSNGLKRKRESSSQTKVCEGKRFPTRALELQGRTYDV